MTQTHLSKNNGKFWGIASIIAMPYLITSALFVIRSFIWITPFPTIWYDLQTVLYWPFQPYFDFTLSLLGGEGISFGVYSMISRSPFVIAPVLVWVGAWQRYHPTRIQRTSIQAKPNKKGFASRRNQALLVMGVTLIFAVMYFTWADFRVNVETGTSLMVRGDIAGMRDYLASFGLWAAVISALLMVFQSIAAPLPAFVITFANGLIFGAFWGTVLSWSSAMAGAILCYYIARVLGRPTAEKIVGAKSLQITDGFFAKYGRFAILIARLIPIISFDVVSYAAGLTSVNLLEFTVATGIGQLPATVVYSYLGENLTSSAQIGLWIVIGVGSLLALSLAAKTYFDGRMAAGVTTKEAK